MYTSILTLMDMFAVDFCIHNKYKLRSFSSFSISKQNKKICKIRLQLQPISIQYTIKLKIPILIELSAQTFTILQFQILGLIALLFYSVGHLGELCVLQRFGRLQIFVDFVKRSVRRCDHSRHAVVTSHLFNGWGCAFDQVI